MTYQELLDAFLAELRALTLKYGVEIGECGCCGSPSLTKIKVEDSTGEARYKVLGPPDEWCLGSNLEWVQE